MIYYTSNRNKSTDKRCLATCDVEMSGGGALITPISLTLGTGLPPEHLNKILKVGRGTNT